MIKSHRILSFLAAGACAASLAMSAQAQAPDTTGKYDPKAEKATQKLELRRASKIVGSHVLGSDNEKLGTIDNLAIDLDSGRTIFAVISTGGVLGVGDKLTAVPCKALKFSDLNNPVRLNITKTSFESAPKMDKDAWNKMNDPTWRTTIYQHYSLDSNWDTPLDIRTGEPRERHPTPATMNIVKTSEAIGMDVRNAQNESLGDLNDLVIDVNRCQVVYSVLGFGGVLGVGEKLFAVPWRSLKLDRAEKTFVLNIDKDKLRNAPGFDRDKWPDMTDSPWSQRVYAFYGTEPDWVYGFAGQGNAKASDANTKGWEAGSDYNRMFNSGTVQTISGEVTDIDYGSPLKGMSDCYILNVRTSDNQTVAVHLGPKWFIVNQGFGFKEGDAVTVTGSRSAVNGKPCIMATEIHNGSNILTLRHKDGTPLWDASRNPSRP